MAICGKNIQRANIVTDGTIIEQLTDFICLGNMTSEFKTDITTKIHLYNKINDTTKSRFGKNKLPSTKLRFYNITSKAALKYGGEVQVLNKKECQQLETAEMKFLRSLLGLTRLEHQMNTTVREKLKAEHIADETQSYQKN